MIGLFVLVSTVHAQWATGTVPGGPYADTKSLKRPDTRLVVPFVSELSHAEIINKYTPYLVEVLRMFIDDAAWIVSGAMNEREGRYLQAALGESESPEYAV